MFNNEVRQDYFSLPLRGPCTCFTMKTLYGQIQFKFTAFNTTVLSFFEHRLFFYQQKHKRLPLQETFAQRYAPHWSADVQNVFKTG